MNTYRNRHQGSPWAGVKPARKVTPEQLEATSMALQIRDLCSQQEFDAFMTMRREGAGIDALRAYHAEVTAPAIAAEEALAADWRAEQADLLDYARGQF